MSGIEIGGLVLAVFPLVISAIDGYRKGLEVMRLWDARNYQAEIEAIGLEIEIQATIFRNSYLTLLQAFTDQRSLVRLLADPKSMQKHGTVITTNLKSYLGGQWQMYSKVMGRLHNTLTALKFNIEKNSQVTPDDWLSKVTSALKPIKFSFGIRNRKGLLQRIKDDNQAFITLTEQKIALKDLEGLNRQREASDLRGLRTQTTALLHTATPAIQCANGATHTHSIGLYLGSFLPHDQKEDWQWLGSEAATRDIFLWIDGPGQKSMQRVDIVCKDTTKSENTDNTLCDVLANFELPEIPPQDEALRTFGRTASPQSRILHTEASLSYQQFKGLGDRLSARKCPVTFPLSGSGSNLELFYSRQPGKDITLHEMLCEDSDFSRFPGYFFEKDRQTLATMIASSALSLHLSPWLNASCSSKSIYLEMNNHDIDEKALLRPYLKAPTHLRSNTCNQGSHDNLKETFGIRNRHLYNLGAILLELIMNKPLQSFKESHTPSETEDQIAWRIERQVCGRAGPVWADIVSKCLHCPFPSAPDLEDEIFLAAVYAEVIQPLIELTKYPKLTKLQKGPRKQPLSLRDSVTEQRNISSYVSGQPNSSGGTHYALVARQSDASSNHLYAQGATMPTTPPTQVTYSPSASVLDGSDSTTPTRYPYPQLRDRKDDP